MLRVEDGRSRRKRAIASRLLLKSNEEKKLHYFVSKLYPWSERLQTSTAAVQEDKLTLVISNRKRALRVPFFVIMTILFYLWHLMLWIWIADRMYLWYRNVSDILESTLDTYGLEPLIVCIACSLLVTSELDLTLSVPVSFNTQLLLT